MGREKRFVALLVLLGLSALGGEGGSSGTAGVSPPRSLNAPSSNEGAFPEERERKVVNPDYRLLRGPLFERVNPRGFLRRGEGGGLKLDWPYAVVSRQDVALTNLLDPDCPGHNIYRYLEVVELPGYEDYRPWPPKRPDGSEWGREEKVRFLKEEAKSRKDEFCPRSKWYLPLSSLEATRGVAKDLKRAWERFEDRYFWRVVTEVNNPAYWFAYCVMGLGVDSTTTTPRSDRDFVPPGTLPPELGGLAQEVLELVSRYGLPGFSPSPRAQTPNYRADAVGQFRKPLYLPFLPTIPPKEFCDGMGFKLPIFHIPAIQIRVYGVPVWSTEGYPDFPFIFDQNEADARIREGMEHAWKNYYTEYMASDVLGALLPTRGAQGLAEGFENLQKKLEGLERGAGGCAGGGEDVLKCLGDLLSSVERVAYFPLPWQVPVLGGGAVVTPVF